MAKQRVIKVTVDYLPKGTSEEEIASFVEDALSSWGGQRHPSDPLFHSLDVQTVQIGQKGTIYSFKEEADDEE